MTLDGGMGSGSHNRPHPVSRAGLPVISRFPLSPGFFAARPRRELTLREARLRAEEARLRWAESDFARLCFVQAGCDADSDPRVHAISATGACSIWHFVYFSREAERFLQVRLNADRTRTEEIRVRAGGLDYPQLRYPFAAGGYCEDRDRRHDPEPPVEPWAGPERCLESMRKAWGGDRVEALADAKALLAWMLPADWLRLPEGADDRGTGAAYARNQSAMVMRSDDVADRLLVARFDLATGIFLG
jgi:hypothetical protein